MAGWFEVLTRNPWWRTLDWNVKIQNMKIEYIQGGHEIYLELIWSVILNVIWKLFMIKKNSNQFRILEICIGLKDITKGIVWSFKIWTPKFSFKDSEADLPSTGVWSLALNTRKTKRFPVNLASDFELSSNFRKLCFNQTIKFLSFAHFSLQLDRPFPCKFYKSIKLTICK